MEEQQGTVDQKPTAKTSPVEPVFGLLEWLAKVSVPLGAMLLAVAALYWLEFIKLYALPVDFSSSGTLSGLPALAAVIAALVGLVAMSALMPIMALVYPLDSEGHTLAHTHQMAAAGDPGTKWGGSLGQRWIILTVALTILWPLVIGALSLLPGIERFLWVLFGLAMVVSYLFILPIYRRATTRKWPPFDVTTIFISGVGTQLMLTFGVFYVAVKTLTDSRVFTLVAASVVYLAVCIALSAVQFIAAKKYVQGWSAQTPKWVVPAALVIMALPLAWPPLGGAIASFPFRVSPAGGGSCVTLVASNLGENTAWADITDKASPGHTLPLGFAARLDDAYYIKLAKDRATYILPAAMVTKVDGCPKPAPKAAAAQATLPAPAAPPTNKDGHMALVALITSILSAIASLLTVFFMVHLWRRSNRPLVTARIATHRGGDVNTALDVLVENAGSQPAINVRLRAKREDVEAAIRNPPGSERLKSAPERIFFSDVTIPVLANGRTVANSFGMLGEDGLWKAGAQLPITVCYEAMDGRSFTEKGVLLLHSDDGFAQTSWDAPADRDIVHSQVVLTDRSNA
ncbi:hypothetical protein LQ772_12005 [Frateuria edaphi]|uniref:hypothetical protein n=1 Tax=Frateuria edaphi TaxID=2898793 RepID=UPI001E5B6E41|nr:hypothetical protein [Frateuria edaphi]UGB44711.1 hypothetical protein LQ772_12005 [Frateuria edaphi]